MQYKDKLPEHWFITITEENAQIVANWLMKKHNLCANHPVYGEKCISKLGTINNNPTLGQKGLAGGRIEISTTEFKVLVLGEKLLRKNLQNIVVGMAAYKKSHLLKGFKAGIEWYKSQQQREAIAFAEWIMQHTKPQHYPAGKVSYWYKNTKYTTAGIYQEWLKTQSK